MDLAAQILLHLHEGPSKRGAPSSAAAPLPAKKSKTSKLTNTLAINLAFAKLGIGTTDIRFLRGFYSNIEKKPTKDLYNRIAKHIAVALENKKLHQLDELITSSLQRDYQRWPALTGERFCKTLLKAKEFALIYFGRRLKQNPTSLSIKEFYESYGNKQLSAEDLKIVARYNKSNRGFLLSSLIETCKELNDIPSEKATKIVEAFIAHIKETTGKVWVQPKPIVWSEIL